MTLGLTPTRRLTATPSPYEGEHPEGRLRTVGEGVIR